MEPEARYTLVGAAVLALIAMLVTAFVWLSYAGSSEYHFYTIHFVQQTLQGVGRERLVQHQVTIAHFGSIGIGDGTRARGSGP